LHRLDRLSDELGIDLWIKRDDLTGFAFGGNKGRKLEYLIGAALSQGATAVVSCGALQSNFIRQLGAACSRHGLKCGAAVMRLPFEGEPAIGGLSAQGGNVLLDELLGIDLRVHEDAEWERLYELMEELAREYESGGEKVYRVPVGGSSPIGAYAFFEAGVELARQASPFDWVVFASSSGSTHTGLLYALAGTGVNVLGIACDPEPEIAEDFAVIGRGLAAMLGVQPLEASDYRLRFEWVGEGYGIPSPEGMASIQLMARRESIFLDPIYSGKAFAGLVAMAKSGELKGRILFWHTGGTPALFAMENSRV
jgi:D-cysteine desulfhydrase family pyridoxal phosphate-dependent enzyme